MYRSGLDLLIPRCYYGDMYTTAQFNTLVVPCDKYLLVCSTSAAQLCVSCHGTVEGTRNATILSLIRWADTHTAGTLLAMVTGYSDGGPRRDLLTKRR